MIHLIFTALAQEYPLQYVAAMGLSVFAVFTFDTLEGEPPLNLTCAPWASWLIDWVRRRIGGGAL